RPGVVRGAVFGGRPGMAGRQLLDWFQPDRGRRGLGGGDLAARPRAFRLGEVAHRGRCRPARHLLLWRGFWPGHQPGAANPERLPARSDAVAPDRLERYFPAGPAAAEPGGGGVGGVGRHLRRFALADTQKGPPAGGGAMSGIVFDQVSKFYGEVLGVNRIHLTIPPGITSLVGPNGSGKTTLMNLMTGLVLPSRGRIEVRGVPTTEPERLFPLVGYCTQFDSFPRGMTARQFITSYLGLFGRGRAEAEDLAQRAVDLVQLGEAADRKLAGYSKGMRQRIRLAQALCHDPQVMILDEPLNGLDPLVRADTIALFRRLGEEGRHVIISSHVLHEVDAI